MQEIGGLEQRKQRSPEAIWWLSLDGSRIRCRKAQSAEKRAPAKLSGQGQGAVRRLRDLQFANVAHKTAAF